MNPLKKMIPFVSLLIGAAAALGGCTNQSNGNDAYTDDGKLIVSMRNLYFENWGGDDAYTDLLEGKFNLSFDPSTYSYNDWNQQVSSAVNANMKTHFLENGKTFERDLYVFAALEGLETGSVIEVETFSNVVLSYEVTK